MRRKPRETSAIETRFAKVFTNLGLLRAYAARRGASDCDGIAAEAMAIAWRRLADVPSEDPRPWLIATAWELVLAERRRKGTRSPDPDQIADEGPEELPAPELELDPELARALASLSSADRELLLLVGWEHLAPESAATTLGISPPVFEVRFRRARRRLLYELEGRPVRQRLDDRDSASPGHAV